MNNEKEKTLILEQINSSCKFTVIRKEEEEKKKKLRMENWRSADNKIIDKLRGHLPRPLFLKIFHFYSTVKGVNRNNHTSDRIVFCMVIYYNLYRLQIGTYGVAFLVRHLKRSGY